MQTAGRGFLLDNKKKQPTSFVNIAKKIGGIEFICLEVKRLEDRKTQKN